jgi:hypothetical protein
MFWRRKQKCNHEWHYVTDDYITYNAGVEIDLEEGCWIICVKCEKEELVCKENWERIKKKQAILNEYRNK